MKRQGGAALTFVSCPTPPGFSGLKTTRKGTIPPLGGHPFSDSCGFYSIPPPPPRVRLFYSRKQRLVLYRCVRLASCQCVFCEVKVCSLL